MTGSMKCGIVTIILSFLLFLFLVLSGGSTHFSLCQVTDCKIPITVWLMELFSVGQWSFFFSNKNLFTLESEYDEEKEGQRERRRWWMTLSPRRVRRLRVSLTNRKLLLTIALIGKLSSLLYISPSDHSIKII
jgi:uncharacterized integral membrane protein